MICFAGQVDALCLTLGGGSAHAGARTEGLNGWLLGLSSYLLDPDDLAGPTSATNPVEPTADSICQDAPIAAHGKSSVHPEPDYRAIRRYRISEIRGISWLGSCRSETAREQELRFRYFIRKVCRLQVAHHIPHEKQT